MALSRSWDEGLGLCLALALVLIGHGCWMAGLELDAGWKSQDDCNATNASVRCW